MHPSFRKLCKTSHEFVSLLRRCTRQLNPRSNGCKPHSVCWAMPMRSRRRIWNASTDTSCGATRVGTDHFHERIHRAGEETVGYRRGGSHRGCQVSRRVHQSFGRGREAPRRIAVAGEEFCRTCLRRRGRVGPASRASGRAPRISERSQQAHEAEDLSSGGHARADSSRVISLDGRPLGGPQSSHRVGHFRRRIPVACSPRRGSLRSLLTNKRTPRCSSRYGLRGDRVGEASHPGPRMSRRGVRRLVSSDEEPLMSAGRDVARVCTTQIDDASSRMIPSTVPAPAMLARVVGECSPCPSDVIDALEDDLAPHRVAHVEVGHRDIPSLILVHTCDVDRVVPCQSAVRWIDMTRGDDDEGGEVHQRLENDTIWMRGEERLVCQQRPSRRVVFGVETHNRFSPLQDTQLEGSRPEEVAMTECSDTESCESAGRPSRRLRLVWNESEAGPEVRNAATLIGVLATRVGAIPHGNVLPGAIRRQRWSALNVPLIWGAASHAESCPVFEWLISVTSAVNEPVHFYGGETTASGAVRIGWDALREAMRSWGVNSEAELSDWLGRNGFPATQPGHHIVARAQEHILTAGCRVDARVGLLESAFVTLTLSEGRQRASGTSRRHTNERRHSTAIPAEVPRESWEQMDQINMEEVFLRRVPMLKSVPHFMRGRFRHNLTVTLQERCRAKLVGDRVGEERAWKAFGLAPAMLLHKPKGVGSIGRVELLERANKFARGQWADLLEELCQSTCSSRIGVIRSKDSTQDAEQKSRGEAACNRVKQGQVS